MRAEIQGSISTADIATFLGGKEKERERVPVDCEFPQKEWVPVGMQQHGREKQRPGAESASGSGSRSHSANEKGEEAKGVWIQRASFHSVFTLRCPPTFGVQNIQCEVRLASHPHICERVVWLRSRFIQYILALTVRFPGIGNNIRLELPVKVTSGIVTSVPRQLSNEAEPSASHAKALDLPP